MREIYLGRGILGRSGNREHIIQTHDDVGDGDDNHCTPEGVCALDALVVAVGVLGNELDCNVKEERAADERYVCKLHCLGDYERQNDTQEHCHAGTEDHAPGPLLRR